MSERFDFHTHSTVSDGSLSPVELVQRAAHNGVRGLALTDHDTVLGVAEARVEGERAGVEVLGGIELSVSEDGGTRALHLLGLGVDEREPRLCARLAELHGARETRAARMVDRLRAAGIEIELSLVEAQAGSGTVGRPHVARALVARGTERDQRATSRMRSRASCAAAAPRSSPTRRSPRARRSSSCTGRAESRCSRTRRSRLEWMPRAVSMRSSSGSCRWGSTGWKSGTPTISRRSSAACVGSPLRTGCSRPAAATSTARTGPRSTSGAGVPESCTWAATCAMRSRPGSRCAGAN